MEVLLAHREQRAPSLRARCDDVPESLVSVYLRMLARDPSDRYASVKDVIHDLETCQRENGLAWLMQRVKSRYKK